MYKIILKNKSYLEVEFSNIKNEKEFEHQKKKVGKELEIIFTDESLLNCNINSLRKEAKKCILLCGNCHSIEHHLEHERIFEYYSESS